MLRVRDRRDDREFWSLVKATATFDDAGQRPVRDQPVPRHHGPEGSRASAQRKATQMSHLYAITAALSETTDVAVIAETLAEQTLTAFGAIPGRGRPSLRGRRHARDRGLAGTRHTGDRALAALPAGRRRRPIGRRRPQERTGRHGSRDEWLVAVPRSRAGTRSPRRRLRSRSTSGTGRSAASPSASTSLASSRADDIGFMLGAARQGAQAWSVLARRRSGVSRRRGSRSWRGPAAPRRVARLPEDPRRRRRPRRAAARRLGDRRDPRTERLDQHARGRARGSREGRDREGVPAAAAAGPVGPDGSGT